MQRALRAGAQHGPGTHQLRVVQDWSDVVSAAADMLTVITVDGVFNQVSAGSTWVVGWTPAELEGQAVGDFVDHHHRHLVADHLARVLGGVDSHLSVGFGFRGRGVSGRLVEAHSRLLPGRASLIVSVLRDATERVRALEELTWRASTDPLTGVANRSTLLDRLAQAIRRLDRQPGTLTVLAVDVDGFKPVNDRLGHAAGDHVLVEIARRIAAHLRPVDTLARTGGDEFVVVVEGAVDDDAAETLALRILTAGREPVIVDGQRIVCTMSVGVSTTTDASVELHDLLREADQALYEAKRQGRDRIERFVRLGGAGALPDSSGGAVACSPQP